MYNSIERIKACYKLLEGHIVFDGAYFSLNPNLANVIEPDPYYFASNHSFYIQIKQTIDNNKYIYADCPKHLPSDEPKIEKRSRADPKYILNWI